MRSFDSDKQEPAPGGDDMLRFGTQVEQYLEDRLSPQEMAGFSDELAASAAKRAFFRGMCVQHQMLRAQHRASADRYIDPTLGAGRDPGGDAGLLAELAEMEAHADVDHMVDLTDRVLASPRQPRPGPRPRKEAEPRGPRVIVIPRPVAWSGIAAVVLLGIGVAYSIVNSRPASPPDAPPLVQRPEPEPTAPAPKLLATVTALADAVVLDSQGRAVAGPLILGDYRVEAGLAGIEMASGATLVIQGPATFRIDSQNAVTLVTGRLAAEVPPQAWGFTVDTPGARIVDIGTAFGVLADAVRGTEVHVFNGEVRAAARTEDGKVREARPVYADQAVAVLPDRATLDPVSFSAAQFERRVVKRLNLIDLIAGEDAATAHRPFGLNPATGGYIRMVEGAGQFKTIFNDGSARRVPSNRYVARVFIPDGSEPLLGLPDGLNLPGLPDTDGSTFGVIWCGGPMPSVDQQQFTSIPNRLPDGQPGFEVEQTMILHANGAIMIDLDQVRNAHPGMQLARLHMQVVNTSGTAEPDSPVNYASDFFVFINDQTAVNHRFLRSDPADQKVLRVDLDLTDASRYLTLVSADADDRGFRDWVVVGDPILVLEPKP